MKVRDKSPRPVKLTHGRQKVFHRGRSLAETFDKDLATAMIAHRAELDRHGDFAALRHAFLTILSRAGAPPRVIMELMCHSDMRLAANTYTDKTGLGVFVEAEELNAFLPSPLAALKSASDRLGASGPVQSDASSVITEVRVMTACRVEAAAGRPAFAPQTSFGAAVSARIRVRRLAEREGFEPPVTLRLHVLSKHAH
jgi:hypothetical protein